MNTKLIIRNQLNEVLQTCIFDNQEALDAFLVVLATGCPYGKPEHTRVVSPKNIIFHPAVLDEQDVEITPESIEIIEEVTELVPSEYTLELVDIALQLEQERINNESLAFLSSTDYLVIRAMEDNAKPVSEEIKLARQNARDSIVR
jgi:hypothetical protein